MKKWVFAAAAAVGLSASAQAAVVTLESQSQNEPNDFTWTYQGTLGPDEGVKSGDRLVIFDFAGYIDGSVFSDFENLVASVEFTSPMALLTPGQDDDAGLVNLVFTYVGPDFQTSGGPFAPLNVDGIGARSTLGTTRTDAFFTLTTKNNPAATAGDPVFTLSTVQVPGGVTAPIPEPATWTMMISGFGLAGMAARRRTAKLAVAA